jgi:hypothetical protein
MMFVYVNLEEVLAEVGFIAHLALVGLDIKMSAFVICRISARREHLRTELALEGFGPSVGTHMHVQVRFMVKYLVAARKLAVVITLTGGRGIGTYFRGLFLDLFDTLLGSTSPFLRGSLARASPACSRYGSVLRLKERRLINFLGLLLRTGAVLEHWGNS